MYNLSVSLWFVFFFDPSVPRVHRVRPHERRGSGKEPGAGGKIWSPNDVRKPLMPLGFHRICLVLKLKKYISSWIPHNCCFVKCHFKMPPTKVVTQELKKPSSGTASHEFTRKVCTPEGTTPTPAPLGTKAVAFRPCAVRKGTSPQCQIGHTKTQWLLLGHDCWW